MSVSPDELRAWIERSAGIVERLSLEPQIERVGRVVSIADGVAMVSGLPQACAEELLVFDGGVYGMTMDLSEDLIGCMLLGEPTRVAAGSLVRGTGTVASVPVGDALLGRVVDPLGRPLDGGAALANTTMVPVERPAPAIVDRALVKRPIHTGLLVVDAMIPLGRGQRQLIVGDRKTGKTSVAVDAMISQKSSDVICVYAAIGQKASSVAQVIDAVKRHGAPDRCFFVAATADSPAGLQWLAPYAACAMGEYFMDRGRDVLLVIDDLTKHAALYRQVSLLLRRPPGREAFPGDVFYIHSRLLERAAHLSPELGGGSLTALPIVETQAGNISAYIPTNIISITDGQIFLDSHLFHQDQKPAVEVGKSVSRVGGATQAPVLKAVARTLKLDYAQFLELEVFTRFGAMVDERSRKTIERGKRIRAVLSQPQFAPLSLGEQVATLVALASGGLDRLRLDRLDTFRAALSSWLAQRCPEVASLTDTSSPLDDRVHGELEASLGELVDTLAESGGRPAAAAGGG